MKGHIKLGADVSAAAGPVGRSAAAEAGYKAGVLTYSSSKGALIGASLNGAELNQDKKTEELYHHDVSFQDILEGKVHTSTSEARLRQCRPERERNGPSPLARDLLSQAAARSLDRLPPNLLAFFARGWGTSILQTGRFPLLALPSLSMELVLIQLLPLISFTYDLQIHISSAE